jgi:hypothetical protein
MSCHRSTIWAWRCSGGWRDVARYLIRAFSLPGVLQNDAAPMIVDHSPFFDLV